jgi:hypothetical protein
MLNAQAKAAAATEEPARRSVPEVVLDGQSWRCVADPIRNRGRSSGQPASWCGSEVVAEAILATSAGEWVIHLANVRSKGFRRAIQLPTFDRESACSVPEAKLARAHALSKWWLE